MLDKSFTSKMFMPQRLNDCLGMGMGRNGNVKSHSRSSLVGLPAYRPNLISYHQPSRSLRSSSQSLLQVPRLKTDFGRRAFSSAAPQIWNHIPAAIKVSPSLDSFKRHLKTHYFTSP